MGHESELVDQVFWAFASKKEAPFVSLADRLGSHGPIGLIALAAFRAQRAKWISDLPHARSAAAKRRRNAIDRLSVVLSEYAESAEIAWGWKLCEHAHKSPHVICIDLPTGQISFRTYSRGAGPDYLR